MERHPERVVARIGGARVGVLHEVIEADAARVCVCACSPTAHAWPGATACSTPPRAVRQCWPITNPTWPCRPRWRRRSSPAARRGGTQDPPSAPPGRSHEQHLLGALADNLDVELPIAYASLDLLTPDGRRWPFVLLRSPMPAGEDGWERSRQMALRWLAEPHALPRSVRPLHLAPRGARCATDRRRAAP